MRKEVRSKMSYKIEKTELEFDEIYKAKVKPFSTGGHIPFYKKFIGRVIKVVLPIPAKSFWLLNIKDIELLKSEIKNIKFPEPYSRQRKEEVEDNLNALKKKEFDSDLLNEVFEFFEGRTEISEKAQKIIKDMGKIYSL